jgi:hypothetical protein
MGGVTLRMASQKAALVRAMGVAMPGKMGRLRKNEHPLGVRRRSETMPET